VFSVATLFITYLFQLIRKGMSEIKNKTVLITGGAEGIGKLMGELCLQEGAKLLVIWDVNRSKTDETVAEFKNKGFEVVCNYVDVSKTDEIIAAAKEVKQQWGNVDILINNAGVLAGNRNFHELNHNDIDFTMNINASGMMHVAVEFVKDMASRKSGHIVNIASAAGMMANPKLSIYCASKHAVVGWSESIRLELEQVSRDIHVTTVTPSYISTKLADGVRSPVVPIVKPDIAARKIIDGLKKNKIYVRMPWIAYTVPFMKGILPQRWLDIMVGKWMGFHKSMDTFKGRN
jgi:all-trans-retinol dehydrogenase (NAD+)